MFTVEQSIQLACNLGGQLTNGWDRQRFNYNWGMAMYAFSYLIRLNRGERLTPYAISVVRYWGWRHFPYAVETACRSWWEINLGGQPEDGVYDLTVCALPIA